MPFEIVSGAMIYITNFIKTGSGIQMLITEDTQRQQGDLISLLLFLQNKENRLKVDWQLLMFLTVVEMLQFVKAASSPQAVCTCTYDALWD
jgi:hypothetical protein